ncbi:MAG: protein jag [Firmicutes bacterium]|nr:protein jag [Bacillota bacterium]
MKVIKKTGKTVNDAVEQALKELGVSRDEVEVEVLEDGTKGIFGILSKNATVLVKLKPNPVDFAFRFISRIIAAMKINVNIDIQQEEDDLIHINLQGPNLGILIGKRGQTLDALQYIVGLAVNKHTDKFIRVIIDGEGYRKRREKTLVQLADRMAKKVKETGKKIIMEPMPPHERRIIHTALQRDPKIFTHSEGEEPYRRIIIDLK